MKKSWHPMLIKNQQQVWLKEKEALEEKKKLDQLRKEREEERQVQELQRLQEEKSGKKKVEKLDWLYATPATGNLTSNNDLDDYLLGKKRVDKILIGDENAKIGSSHKNFIAVQNANTARDIASKVREDPLFTIMQQQSAAIKEIKENPLRLKELQKRTGIMLQKEKDKKDRKDKKDKKDKKKSKKRDREGDDDERREKRRRIEDNDRGRDRHRGRSYSRSPSGSPHPSRRIEDNGRRRRDRHRGRSYSRSPSSSPHPSRRNRYTSASSSSREAERAARLAAMSANAEEMLAERNVRLAQREEEERNIREKEEEERRQNARDGVKGGSFLDSQHKRLMAGNLGDRMREGRRGLVVQRD